MKRTILLSFLTLLIFSITSCDEDKTKTDADIINDSDITTDEDISTSDIDLSDLDITDTDTVPDIDELPDIDDICAQPIDYSLLPFTDDKGNIHFCREGCDTPTANDPQCVTNLWKEDNEELCTKYPQLDCCGYPCDMDNLRPMYDGDFDLIHLHQCDIALNAMNPIGWDTGHYTMKSFNFQEGKIGFRMSYVGGETDWHVNQVRAFEYDLTTKKYSVKSITDADMLAYNKGKFLTYIRIKDTDLYSITYYSHETYTFVYPKPVYFIVYTPALTDKWAFANIREKDGESSYMKYALIKEHDGTASYENIAWNWISLGEGIANDPNIVDDRLVFYVEGFKGYICELNEEPTSLDDCKVLNRTIDGEMEEIRHPIIDKNNKDLIYFNPVDMTDGFMRLDTSKEPWEYKKFEVQNKYTDTYSLVIQDVTNNLISYGNIILKDGNPNNKNNIVCMYRVDQEKSYCPADGDSAYGSYTEFDGHYIAWQLPGNPELHVRDMECYCDMHPEVCPYDDYTPNPACPKNIKTGEHECGDDDESPDADAM